MLMVEVVLKVGLSVGLKGMGFYCGLDFSILGGFLVGGCVQLV